MKRCLPISSWLPNYEGKWFRADLIAGLTITALLVPEGMAYAELAGVPPQTAFYAAPIGLLLYAAFGSSRQLVVAVSSGIAVMSASIVGGIASPDSTEYITLTAGLAILAGLVAATWCPFDPVRYRLIDVPEDSLFAELFDDAVAAQQPEHLGLDPSQPDFSAVGLGNLDLLRYLDGRADNIRA